MSDFTFNAADGKAHIEVWKQNCDWCMWEALKATGDHLVVMAQHELDAIPFMNKPKRKGGTTQAHRNKMRRGIRCNAHYPDIKVSIMYEPTLRLIENGTASRSYISRHGLEHFTGETEGKGFFQRACSRTQELTNYYLRQLDYEMNRTY